MIDLNCLSLMHYFSMKLFLDKLSIFCNKISPSNRLTFLAYTKTCELFYSVDYGITRPATNSSVGNISR
uniref:Uncharacterized protein n=1 Tax=Rhizophora mucronata TaxID=61149 RepID=A0A2P2P3E3_RHIMU